MIIRRLNLILLSLSILLLMPACSNEPSSLVVYSGKGLKKAVDEIVEQYKKESNVKVSVVYAGSNTLFNTIQETKAGDIFIAGSKNYIDKLTFQTKNTTYLAKHIPVFVIHKDNNEQIESFKDLYTKDIRIAIGNKEFAAVGRVSEAILESSLKYEEIQNNIVVKASTVNELLQLVNSKEVDAALIWADMLTWDNAKELKTIAIPMEMNIIKEIWAAELAFSSNPKEAKEFFKFLRDSGYPYFKKHGFDQ